MARLKFEDADGKVTIVELNDKLPEVTIGRNAGNVLRIVDPSISRHHARIALAGGVCVLSDLGSANGSYVNEERVDERILADGDKIRCGDFELQFDEGKGGMEATTATIMLGIVKAPLADDPVRAELADMESFLEATGLALVALADELDIVGEDFAAIALALARMRHLKPKADATVGDVRDLVQHIWDEETDIALPEVMPDSHTLAIFEANPLLKVVLGAM